MFFEFPKIFIYFPKLYSDQWDNTHTMKSILAFLSGIGLGFAVLYGCKTSEGVKEVNFRVKIKAYDTKIDSATIEGFTIKNPSDLVVRVGNIRGEYHIKTAGNG